MKKAEGGKDGESFSPPASPVELSRDLRRNAGAMLVTTTSAEDTGSGQERPRGQCPCLPSLSRSTPVMSYKIQSTPSTQSCCSLVKTVVHHQRENHTRSGKSPKAGETSVSSASSRENTEVKESRDSGASDLRLIPSSASGQPGA